MTFRKLIFSILLLTFSFPSYAQKRSQLPDLPEIAFTKVVLENGLTVVVHEDHKAPIVAVNVWYHVGSKNEPEGRKGFAHLFEHLMFQGSENYNDDYFKALEKVGATDLNGTTWYDRTNYFQNVPSTELDTALFMESDRMGHFAGAISKARLDEQVKVVINEKQRGDNQPYWGVASPLLTEGLFPVGHPYSWETIGSEKDLKAAKLKDVREWFKKYYGPNNATLTIAGDIKTDVAIEKAKKYFEHIPPGPRLSKMREWVAKREESRYQTVQDNVPFGRLIKAWNIPGLMNMETITLDLVSDILSVGKSSRLYKEIVYKKQLATNISASIWPAEIAGVFMIDATAKKGVSLEELDQAIQKTLRKFLREGPTKDELHRAKMAYATRFISGVEKVGHFSGKANLLASGQVYANDPGIFKKQYEHRRQLRSSDTLSTAKKWLTSGDFNLWITPFPQLKKSAVTVNRSKLPISNKKPKASFPKTQTATLSNGAKVILLERNHIPEITIDLMMDTGYAKDPKNKKGLTHITFDLLNEGTKKKNLFEISNRLSQLGSSISTFAGIDQAGLYAKMFTKNADATIALLSEIALAPSFPKKELERLKKQTIESIQKRKADPRALSGRVFRKLLFGEEHPYGVPASGFGYEDMIKSITRNEIIAFYSSWSKPNGSTFLVVGDTTLQEITNLLEKHFSRWNKGEVPQTKIPVVNKEVNAGKMFVIDKPDAPQTAILVGQFAPALDDPQAIPLSVMNRVLGGGFTSRINMNLREEKGWSYGAYSNFSDLGGTRFFNVNTTVQTDKTAESVAEILREIQGIRNNEPVSQSEFRKQQNKAIFELAGTWETNSAVSSWVEQLLRNDMPLDFYQGYSEKLEKLSLSDVRNATSFLRPKDLTWLLVGDTKEIVPVLKKRGFDITLLDKNGDVIEN